MKKKIIIVYLLIFTCYLLPAQSGIIRELSGDVELKPANASAFSPAREGSAVAQDTLVSTGFRSMAIIEVNSTIINVRPLTRMTLAEIQSMAEEETVNINLQTGRIRVDVKPPAGTRASTRVQSPSSTASVRGTSFEVDVMNIFVTEGKVIYRGNSGFSVPVTAGSVSAVNSEGIPVNPILIAEAELTPASPVDITLTGEMAANTGTIQDSLELEVMIGFD